MMFVDASALVAIMLNEADAHALLVRLDGAASAVTSPLAIWETAIAFTRVRKTSPTEAHRMVEDFLVLMNIEQIALTPDETRLAIEAFERYGKGRHPAGLNFGDCFAYACAKQRRIPLLFKGDDFVKTDIAAA